VDATFVAPQRRSVLVDSALDACFAPAMTGGYLGKQELVT